MKKRKVVIATSNVSAHLSLIRCIGESNYDVDCFAFGQGRTGLLDSKYIANKLVFDTPLQIIDYLLSSKYPVHEKTILLTDSDELAFAIDSNYKKLTSKFILFSANNEQGQIKYWMDKKNQWRLAQKIGLRIPKTQVITKDNVKEVIIDFPVFSKSPISAICGKGIEGVCNNYNDINYLLDKIPTGELVVQKYIKKLKEVNFFGLAWRDRVYIDFKDERLRFPNTGFGHYGKFTRVEYNDLYDKVLSFVKETGFQGVFDMEFIVDKEGEYYFMEMNLRVDGAAYRLSKCVNLPAEWCRLVYSDSVPSNLAILADESIGMDELADFKSSVILGKMNFFKWFWEFLSADTHTLFNFKDPKPVLYKFIYEIGKRIKAK